MKFVTVTEFATGNKRIIRSEDIKSVSINVRRQITVILFIDKVPDEEFHEALFVKESIEEIQSQLK